MVRTTRTPRSNYSRPKRSTKKNEVPTHVSTPVGLAAAAVGLKAAVAPEGSSNRETSSVVSQEFPTPVVSNMCTAG